MPTVLVVHHSPTPAVAALTRAVVDGVTHPDLEDAVAAREVEALEATAEDVLAADAVVLVTPVNFGYISGALKHFFDSTFRRLEDATGGLPFAAVIKGTTDATGAVRAIEAITTGMAWRRAADHLVIEGDVGEEEVAAAVELGGTLAATLLL